MTPELAKHLDKARDTVTEIDRIVSSHQYPGDTRTVMIRGLLATITEHHRSILQLLKSGAVDSSYALARDVVKGMRYGLWINSPSGSGRRVPTQHSRNGKRNRGRLQCGSVF